MSSGKRLAKRSILGTRIVAAPYDDGIFYPGVIQSSKAVCETESRFMIRFDGSGLVREYRGSEIIGPGFSGLTGSKLRAGQIVYITHGNREVNGSVIHHRPNIDQVIIQILNGGPEVMKKLDEVRLVESRKSARLIGHGNNTDFSKLADLNIVTERKRINFETLGSSSGSSRKRNENGDSLCEDNCNEFPTAVTKTSNSSNEINFADDENVPMNLTWGTKVYQNNTAPLMTESTAAIVLMNMSNSPSAGNQLKRNLATGVPSNVTAIDGPVSPSGSSGVSSTASSWNSVSIGTNTAINPNLTEAEALLALSLTNQDTDEGIVSDQSSSSAESEVYTMFTKSVVTSSRSLLKSSVTLTTVDGETCAKKSKKQPLQRLVYVCLWRGCTARMDVCEEMERHVRQRHLGRDEGVLDEEEDGGHEEEFYYTEVEVPLHELYRPASSPPVSSSNGQWPQPLILVEHLDMVRPPHENPEYYQRSKISKSSSTMLQYKRLSGSNTINNHAEINNCNNNFICQSNANETLNSNNTVLKHTIPKKLAPINSQNFSFNAKSSNVAQSGGSVGNMKTIGKYVNQNANKYSGPTIASTSSSSSSSSSSSTMKSPVRRPRGDAKKCRKVYGMDHRHMWCTQCKWKKACTRFGEIKSTITSSKTN